MQGSPGPRADTGFYREVLQQVITHAPMLMYVLDSEGVFELSEGRALERMGLSANEVVGQNAFELYADDEAALALVRRALAGEEAVGRVRVGDRIFDARLVPLRRGGEAVDGALGVSVDVTESARQEERLAFQARLLAHVGQAVIATDPDGRVVYWNRAAEELYGWPEAEALGARIGRLVVAEGVDQPSPDSILAQLRAGDRWAGEYVVRRQDGSTFPAFISAVPLFEDGRLTALIGVSSDLSDRKRLEEELRQAQKMEAVGQLAGGIAHDFNNLLTAIGGYAGMAADRAEDPQLAGDIGEVVRATDRARALVDKLLAFSRRSRSEPRPVDIEQTVETTAGMLGRMIGEHIRLVVQTPGDGWRVRIDPVQMEQVLLNLALNARDAMREGGTLTLRVDPVTLDAAQARRLDPVLAPGDHVRLTVADTGSGIPLELQSRIFDPFFTTKEVGKGSGLGLSMVFGTVKQARGAIAVESEEGAGTRFAIYLPRALGTAEEPAAPAPESRSEPVAGGRERILLVEDEAAVRRLVRRVLEREGYGILEAQTGQEAVAVLEADAAPVDLVLTDVIMPEMGGPELVERLQSVRPGLRSLFMSGYTAEELRSRGVAEPDIRFLPKPFTPAQLVRTLRQALDD